VGVVSINSSFPHYKKKKKEKNKKQIKKKTEGPFPKRRKILGREILSSRHPG